MKEQKRFTEKQLEFLKKFEVYATIVGTSRASDVDRKSVQRWLKDNPAFAEAFAGAESAAGDNVFTEAVRKAMFGWDEVETTTTTEQRKDGGVVTKTTERRVHRFSEAMHIWLLNYYRGNPARLDVEAKAAMSPDGTVGVQVKMSLDVARAIVEQGRQYRIEAGDPALPSKLTPEQVDQLKALPANGGKKNGRPRK